MTYHTEVFNVAKTSVFDDHTQNGKLADREAIF